MPSISIPSRRRSSRLSAGPVNPTTFVVVPSYRTPPTQVAYFFTDRDAFRTDNVFRTDLAVNYSYRVRGAELFFQTQVWNLFNGDAIADVNNIDVTTRTRDGGATNLVRFNPFTDTPVQGTHWEPGPNFGTARNKNAYQLPRQIRFSFGIRF